MPPTSLQALREYIYRRRFYRKRPWYRKLCFYSSIDSLDATLAGFELVNH